MRRAPAALALTALTALAACGPAAQQGVRGDTPDGAEAVVETLPLDSALVRTLTDVALADARADLAPTPRRAAVADSLRGVALRSNATTAAAFTDRQRRLARDPAEARATYDAVQRALSNERFGASGQ